MLTLVTAPATTPVTLAEAKAEIPVLHSDDDTRITRYINAATAHLDGYKGVLGNAIVTQTWKLTLPEFEDRMRLPLPPVQSLTSVTYLDADEASQTFSSVHLETDGVDTWVALDTDASWPTTANRDDAVTITFVTGYGDDETAVPDDIRELILHMVCCWFNGVSQDEINKRVNMMMAPKRNITL